MIKLFENFTNEYKWYVAIYKLDSNMNTEEMKDKAKLLKSFLDKYWTGAEYIKLDYKICYFKSSKVDPECIAFYLKNKMPDIVVPWPTELSTKNGRYIFKLIVRENRKTQEEILQHEIPDDIDLFFMANKYNL